VEVEGMLAGFQGEVSPGKEGQVEVRAEDEETGLETTKCNRLC
jgi:hypothetical protein